MYGIFTGVLALIFVANGILYIYRYKKQYRYGVDIFWYILSVAPLFILAQHFVIITLGDWFGFDLIKSSKNVVGFALFWQQVVLFSGQVKIIRNYHGNH